jgi:YidC/Oxa1 family membrane protein insertase
MVDVLGSILGYVMRLCYNLLHNYGIAIILFVFITKIILSPISIWVHKNGIKLVKLQPEINFLMASHYGDKEYIAEEQSKLYRLEKYNPLASLIPLAIQIILLMGIINVIYNPLTHILKLPADLITSLISLTGELTGADISSNSIQLWVLGAVKNTNYTDAFLALQGSFPSVDMQSLLDSIAAIDMHFLGFELSWVPSQMKGITILVPIIAALVSWLQCFTQNKSAVLQSEQGKFNKYSTMALSVGLSLYLGWYVPVGVALYWVFSISFAIIQMYILNIVISPKKYIDYERLEESRKILAELNKLGSKKQKWYQKDPNRKRERADYKRFFSVANKHLVFFSEKSGFYKYFKGIIEYLLTHSNVIIHYVTNDPEDAIFKNDNPRIRAYYIGPKKIITLMMKMDADIVVMTTPDLHNYYIKRSYIRDDIEYVYVPHGVSGSINLNLRKGALDHFDTVFMTNDQFKREILALEEVNHLPRKNLVEYGYALLDEMIAEYDALPKKNSTEKTVVIAPSWQKDNIMESCIELMLDNMVGHDYRIIVRPHPQYMRHHAELVEALRHKYANVGDNIVFETDFSSSATIYSADLLITDWSNVGYEFCFTTTKPGLFIHTPMKIMNTDYRKIDIESFASRVRPKIGREIMPDEIPNINEVISDLLARADEYHEVIDQIRRQEIYNFGYAAEAGAKYLISSMITKKTRRYENENNRLRNNQGA